MHPTAKKCIQWSVGLFVLGAAVVIQALAGGTRRPAEDPDRNRNHPRNHTRGA